MSDETVSFETVISLFHSEDDCVQALFKAKWPDGFRCPRCRHPFAYVISTRRLPLYECRACRSQTSLISGTVMEGSRTPLHLWFQAIYLHARPDGINALQLSRVIRVTYKTAWLMCHKLRHAMSHAESTELLSGVVHISDAIYCARYIPSLDWHKQEQPLIIGSSSNQTKNIVRIKMKKQNKQTLRNRYACPDEKVFIRENVDAAASVQRMVPRRIGRRRNKTLVQLSGQAERWLAETFRGIGPKHLQVYLDQFCYMWNRSKKAVFTELLRDCSITPTITYRVLTGCDTVRPARPSRRSATASRMAS